MALMASKSPGPAGRISTVVPSASSAYTLAGAPHASGPPGTPDACGSSGASAVSDVAGASFISSSALISGPRSPSGLRPPVPGLARGIADRAEPDGQHRHHGEGDGG